jgi:hypothetical protein
LRILNVEKIHRTSLRERSAGSLRPDGRFM